MGDAGVTGFDESIDRVHTWDVEAIWAECCRRRADDLVSYRASLLIDLCADLLALRQRRARERDERSIARRIGRRRYG